MFLFSIFSSVVVFLLLCAVDEYEALLLSNGETDLVNVVQTLQTKLQSLEQEFQDFKKKVSGDNTYNVAFRAMLNADIGTVSSKYVIIFDDVQLNLGNAYDVRHGVFTAPHNGTYTFSMALTNPVDHHGQIYMMKNGQIVEYAFGGFSDGWTMGGVTTVVELFANDDVWIEGKGYISGKNAPQNLHTGFSGMLVRPY